VNDVTSIQQPEALLTVKDVCKYLGVSQSLLFSWHVNGTGPAVYSIEDVGLRYRLGDIDKFLRTKLMIQGTEL